MHLPVERIKTNFLVLGSGVAGLRAALALAEAGAKKILVATKGKITDSNTDAAQGGVAAALSDEDSVALHEGDTLRAGDGLCRPEAVRILAEEGPRRVEELIAWGAAFDKDGAALHFAREGAHSAKRVLHAGGDATGREVQRTLTRRALETPGIEIVPHAFALQLLADREVCRGAEIFCGGRLLVVEARATILATGGAGRVYLETTNPPVATGDGPALAFRAGATLADMEFFQFHPTALYMTGAPRFLLTEALRGEGGRLVNVRGEPFMKKYHAMGDLAPRDVVARAIVLEARLTNHPCAYLDLRHLGEDFLKKRFPAIHATCAAYGADISREKIPVLPAAHYFMGGVAADLDGRTTLPGLFAAGEAACAGIHGANRLASNSLLDGLVFGARAGVAAAAVAEAKTPLAWKEQPFDEHYIQPETKRDILTLAWEKAGIFRNARGLARAVAHLERVLPTLEGRFAEPWACEVQNAALVVLLLARAALAREESRGAHYREDFPEKSPAWESMHSFVGSDGVPRRGTFEERFA